GWVRAKDVYLDPPPVMTMRLDRMTRLGSSDTETGARIGTAPVTGSGRVIPPPNWNGSVAVLNGKAISLPKPAYPATARSVHAHGAVNVQVIIDENGHVVGASAVSGHPLLRAAAVSAARSAQFSP